MSLKISKKEGLFYLNGKINLLNYKSLINYIEYNFKLGHNVTINIDYVNEMDKSGLESINILKTMALENCKIFDVLGKVK